MKKSFLFPALLLLVVVSAVPSLALNTAIIQGGVQIFESDGDGGCTISLVPDTPSSSPVVVHIESSVLEPSSGGASCSSEIAVDSCILVGGEVIIGGISAGGFRTLLTYQVEVSSWRVMDAADCQFTAALVPVGRRNP